MLQKNEYLFSGRVQGVYFRKFIQRSANKLGVFGYAENLKNEKVLAVLVGTEEKIEKMLELIKKGNGLSSVEEVELIKSDKVDKNEFQKFDVKRNGNNLFSDQFVAIKNLITNILRNIFNRSEANLSKINLPRHVAVIPDGNRRWAIEKGLPIFIGHKKGSYRVKDILKFVSTTKIESITFWLFSTENWKREKQEVEQLMNLFEISFEEIRKTCIANKIYFRYLGKKIFSESKIIKFLVDLENETRQFKDLENYKNLNFAFDYGGRDEILRAVNSLRKSEKTDENINGEIFEKYLDTVGIPDPDLIIRTGGEKRLSGLFPWQAVYSELYFTDVYFPDFGIPEFQKALEEYGVRKRRFGK